MADEAKPAPKSDMQEVEEGAAAAGRVLSPLIQKGGLGGVLVAVLGTGGVFGFGGWTAKNEITQQLTSLAKDLADLKRSVEQSDARAAALRHEERLVKLEEWRQEKALADERIKLAIEALQANQKK